MEINCFNYSCPFAIQKTSAGVKCGCTTCPNRADKPILVFTSNHTLSENEMLKMQMQIERKKQE